MRYEQFALLYDRFMNDVPYDKWVEYVERTRQAIGITGKTLLDVACGTGNVTLPLVQRGYDVTGIDLSEDMLTVAQQKLAAAGYIVPFYQQDMRELELPQQFDCITIFCDSLNYVTEATGIQETFARVHRHLKQGGLFLFDVHSLYKMHHMFMDETYTVNEEDAALIWNCFPGEYPDSVEHELTFFVRDEQEDIYYRFDEIHVQRTYSIPELQEWLEVAGFLVMSIIGDFSGNVTEQTERVFFAAKKKP